MNPMYLCWAELPSKPAMTLINCSVSGELNTRKKAPIAASIPTFLSPTSWLKNISLHNGLFSTSQWTRTIIGILRVQPLDLIISDMNSNYSGRFRTSTRRSSCHSNILLKLSIIPITATTWCSTTKIAPILPQSTWLTLTLEMSLPTKTWIWPILVSRYTTEKRGYLYRLPPSRMVCLPKKVKSPEYKPNLSPLTAHPTKYISGTKHLLLPKSLISITLRPSLSTI